MEHVVNLSHIGGTIRRITKGVENWDEQMCSLLSSAIRVAGSMIADHVEIKIVDKKGSVVFYDEYLNVVHELVFNADPAEGYITNFGIPRNPVMVPTVAVAKTNTFPFHRLTEIIKRATSGEISIFEKIYEDLSYIVFSDMYLSMHVSKQYTVTEMMNQLGRLAITTGLTDYDFDYEITPDSLVLIIRDCGVDVKHIVVSRCLKKKVQEQPSYA